MHFTISKLKSKRHMLFAYVLMLYLFVMSGSVIQIAYMSELQSINTAVTAAVLVLIFLRHAPRLTVRSGINLSFIVIAGLSGFLIMANWAEFAYWKVYLSNFALLMMAFIVSEILDFSTFRTAFTGIMVLLSLISIILFYVPCLLKYLPSVSISVSSLQWQYEFYFIYAKYSQAFNAGTNRNIGIFWEPGMYQGYLIMATMLILSRKKQKHDVLKLFILFITLLSTQSATGYILLGLMLCISILHWMNKWKWGLCFSVCLAAVLALILFYDHSVLSHILNQVLPPDVSDKLLNSSNTSRNTRIYGFIGDWQLALRYPLGIGQTQIEPLRQQQLSLLHASTDANVNTSITMLLYHGFLAGIFYAIILLRAGLALGKNMLTGILSIAVLFIIMNTEPHYLTILMNVLLLYCAQKPLQYRVRIIQRNGSPIFLMKRNRHTYE